MKVAVLTPLGNDYMRDENDNPLYFSTENEAKNWLLEHNYTAQQIMWLGFEEIEE